jgi:branched-chain amino acid transport system permease protein
MLGKYMLHIVMIIGIYLISVYGLNILTGYCGQISLAQGALMGVGGYTSGLLTTLFGAPIFISVPIAGITAALCGLLLGAFSFLRVFAVGIVTLIAAGLFGYVLQDVRALDSLTGGPDGLMLPAANRHLVFYMILAGVMVVLAANEIISRTKLGQEMTLIREHKIQTPGADYPYRLLAFSLCGFFAGLSGSLFSHSYSFILPLSFDMSIATLMTLMLIVGGMGTSFGALISVTLLVLIQELFFRELGYHAYIIVVIVLAVGFLFIYRTFFRLIPGDRAAATAESIAVPRSTDPCQTALPV